MSQVRRSKILVVSDEKGIVNTLKISLESGGYRVVEAYTGDGAIRKERSESPDLILIAGMDLGADEYITKPFDHELKAKIRNLLV